MKITTLAFLALFVAGCTATVSPSTEPSPSGETCAASGCTVVIETQPSPGSNDVCQAARVGGVLTADPTYGLGVRGDSGLVHGVLWPYGYSARREPGGIVLIDRSGRVVAREGDDVVMGGVVNADGVHWPCYEPHLEVVRSGAAVTSQSLRWLPVVQLGLSAQPVLPYLDHASFASPAGSTK